MPHASAAPTFGNVIGYTTWCDACRLLKAQVSMVDRNRHFRTSSMLYYQRLGPAVDVASEAYFHDRICTNGLYLLSKEFWTYWYPIPKGNLAVRRYAFMSYPMRVAYYAAGLYLLGLAQQFVDAQLKLRTHLRPFYGGDLRYSDGKLGTRPEALYFMGPYKAFRARLHDEERTNTENKLVIRLDVASFFDELPMDNLLRLLYDNITPGQRGNCGFDTDAISELQVFYRFCEGRPIGIPQTDNDVVSGYLGWLYLLFADICVEDTIRQRVDLLQDYSVVRYVDDLHLCLSFRADVSQKERADCATQIASAVSDLLYSRFHLRLNTKTQFMWLRFPEDCDRLRKVVKLVSSGYEMYDPDDGTDGPNERVGALLRVVDELKDGRDRTVFERDVEGPDEVLKAVYDKAVHQLLSRADYQSRLCGLFTGFNFHMVKLFPQTLTAIILTCDTARASYRDFLLALPRPSSIDADLLLRFLCICDLDDPAMLAKLAELPLYKPIIAAIENPCLASDKPGYFDLAWPAAKSVLQIPEAVVQARARLFAEREGAIPLAVNHLLNEIQVVCAHIAGSSRGTDAQSVEGLLYELGVGSGEAIRVRNLFDLRNNNRISHPSGRTGAIGPITADEYVKYRRAVGQCLACVLSTHTPKTPT